MDNKKLGNNPFLFINNHKKNYFNKLKNNWFIEMSKKNTLLERSKYILNKIKLHKNSKT